MGGINQYIEIKEDGFYDIDPTTSTTSVGISMRSAGTDTTDAPCNIVLEMIPNYPDALVFDGVDDYGVNRSVPSLSDYTIIVKKKALDNKGVVCATIGNFGEVAFVISDKFNRDNGMVFANSFSLESLVKWVDNISYQTKNSYNGETISVGKIVTTHGFSISMYGGRYWKGAFYSAYLFDRSLDEQEIKAFIRKYIDPEYLLPSEIPTPDCYYDFSKGSNDDETRDTIKDYSGNGNDAVAHNFAWSGMSGYDGYPIDFKTEYAPALKSNRVNGTLTSSKITITSVTDVNNFLESNRIEKHKSYKIKVTGVNDDLYIRYFYSATEYYNIKTEGIHVLPESDKVQFIGFRATKVSDSCNITIELIPEYIGALVFDGVDDYVSLDAFDSGFKTIFMVCTFFSPDLFIYDQRNNTIDNENALTTNNGEPCYYGRNRSGITYINGLLNDYKPGLGNSIYPVNTKGKKHLITCAFINGVNTTTPIIANRYDKGYQYLKMNLYKFLGFKEALTEEQIQAVIKKYNLLDGVDEIEVS